MALYITDTTTGEMTPLDLSPLRRGQRQIQQNRATKLRNQHRAYQRRKVNRLTYRRPQPLIDLAFALGCSVLALAILVVTVLRPV
jgi:hypothetical protein